MLLLRTAAASCMQHKHGTMRMGRTAAAKAEVTRSIAAKSPDSFGKQIKRIRSICLGCSLPQGVDTDRDRRRAIGIGGSPLLGLLRGSGRLAHSCDECCVRGVAFRCLCFLVLVVPLPNLGVNDRSLPPPKKTEEKPQNRTKADKDKPTPGLDTPV